MRRKLADRCLKVPSHRAAAVRQHLLLQYPRFLLMPVLSNPRHERFAQELAAGKTGTAAYVAAGYKESPGAASRLSKDVNIRERVAELLNDREQNHAQATAAAIERVSLTKEWVLSRLIANALAASGERPVRKLVLRKGASEPVEVQVTEVDRAAANRAYELLGREVGLFIERKEIGAPGEFDALDEDRLIEEIKRDADELGVPVGETAH